MEKLTCTNILLFRVTGVFLAKNLYLVIFFLAKPKIKKFSLKKPQKPNQKQQKKEIVKFNSVYLKYYEKHHKFSTKRAPVEYSDNSKEHDPSLCLQLASPAVSRSFLTWDQAP